MKKNILSLLVAICLLSCTKEEGPQTDPNGNKNNKSISVERPPTMVLDAKKTTPTFQSANGDAGVAGDPFGK